MKLSSSLLVLIFLLFVFMSGGAVAEQGSSASDDIPDLEPYRAALKAKALKGPGQRQCSSGDHDMIESLKTKLFLLEQEKQSLREKMPDALNAKICISDDINAELERKVIEQEQIITNLREKLSSYVDLESNHVAEEVEIGVVEEVDVQEVINKGLEVGEVDAEEDVRMKTPSEEKFVFNEVYVPRRTVGFFIGKRFKHYKSIEFQPVYDVND